LRFKDPRNLVAVYALDFQFSFWDSIHERDRCPAGRVVRPFNSLFEIRNLLFYLCIFLSQSFNSLFEIHFTRKTLLAIYCTTLSILFLRFDCTTAVRSHVECFYFQFSFWDSDSYKIISRGWLWTFNSLFEIQAKLYITRYEAINFQFSFWDSIHWGR